MLKALKGPIEAIISALKGPIQKLTGAASAAGTRLLKWMDELQDWLRTGKRKTFQIAGQGPRLSYAKNVGGLFRSEEEVIDIVRRAGLDIPDDVVITVGSADRFGATTFDEFLSGKQFTGANIGSMLELPEGASVYWKDYYTLKGVIPIRLNPEILQSDEAIVGWAAHELYELEQFREFFARNRGCLPVEWAGAEAMAGNPGNFHDKAWDYADVMVAIFRESR